MRRESDAGPRLGRLVIVPSSFRASLDQVVVPLGELDDDRRGLDALGHHPHLADDLVHRAPPAQLLTDIAIAALLGDARSAQVAHPCQPGEREDVAAHGARHLAADRHAEPGPLVLARERAVELHERLEPGAPSPRARLDLVRAIREAGFDCGVLLAPVLPGLTDSAEHLETAVSQLAAAGATSVTPIPLHLRPGAREWFMAWLSRERPDLIGAYEDLYGRGAYVRASYGEVVASRLEPLLERYGLDRSARGRARGLTAGEDEEHDSAGVRPAGEQLTLM